jgi:putative transferase (TIGR04331 family)
VVTKTLVTTADERTWPKGQPILFLGEWCRRYSRKSVWNNLDTEIEPYHWDDRKKLYLDYQCLQELYEKLLVDLSYKLNQIHSVEHSTRYWRILIGPWLGFFTQMLFDRWCMLGQTIEKRVGLACRVLERRPLSMVPNHMHHFVNLFIQDDWNEAIYGELLEKCWPESITVEKIPNQQDNSQTFAVRQGWKSRLKYELRQRITRLNTLFPNETEYFFLRTYLPRIANFRLQIRLGQIPRFPKLQLAPEIEPAQQQRKWHLGEDTAAFNTFEQVIRRMIPLHIPTAYLEGYQILGKKVDHLLWPSSPAAIFTTNAYSSDDIFKAWAAEKTESGTPLVIGQHGGHMGMSSWAFHEEHQIAIADRWISWGWSDAERPKIIPIGNLKEFGSSAVKYNPSGIALMIETTNGSRYSYHMYAVPVAGQWISYFEDQCRFIASLRKDLQEQLLVRIYPKDDIGWDQNERWQARFPNVQLDLAQKPVRELVGNCRLNISTYNGTNCLELLSWNVPTIMFWNLKHWELKEDIKPYFDALKSVGIFHERPESAAQQMTEIWDDVKSWWESDDVQSARLIFCDQFSRRPDDPLGELERMFRQIAL